MGVDIVTYRARIGLHNLKCSCSMRPFDTKVARYNHQASSTLYHTMQFSICLLPLIIYMLLICSGNVELNPGPMNKSKPSANITIDKYTFNQNYKQITDLQ